MQDIVVVGGGPAGLSTAAVLKRRGLPAVVLEQEQIAASWRRHYDRLHLHTVRWLSHLPGYRFSRRHGKWVSRDGVVRYLERYARHHELDVRTGVEVRRINRGDHGWVLETGDGPIEARAVVVATGYNRVPFLPDWPGRDSFEGELVHGQDYRNPEPYRDRDVLVVGSGNTGAEICVDLVDGGAARVRMAIRTPPNVLLRDVNGMPSQVNGVLMRRLPLAIADPIARMGQRLTVGDLSEYGITKPPRGPFVSALRDDVIPILDVGLVRLLKQGEVEVVPALEGFDGPDVLLAGGERIQPDAVIACAGYRRGLEPLVGHLGVLGDKGRPIVHGGETHPDAPDLHFIGYTNPISGMFREFGIDARRIARAQAARKRQAIEPIATTMT
jgi:putative flavoprotein involved in K+ transport